MRDFILGAMSLMVGIVTGCGRGGQGPAITDLGAKEYEALGTAVPCMAEHRGRLLVFWRGHAGRETRDLEDIPRLPDDALRPTRSACSGTVAYANELADGRWFGPSCLAPGCWKCDPEFSWSDSRGLNILLEVGDEACTHLLLENGKSCWAPVRHFREPGFGEFVFLGIEQSGDDLHATTFTRKELKYWHYDGAEWRKPVVIEDRVEFDGTWGYFSPRLAVDSSGRIHVVWNAQTQPTHVILEAGNIVSKSKIALTPRVHRGNHNDVAAIDGGRLLLVYQADEEDPAASGDCIYAAEFDGKSWGAAAPIGVGTGLTLGSPQLVSHAGEALVVWQHRGEARRFDMLVGQTMVVSGPTASFMVRDRAGVWASPKPIRPVSTGPLLGLDDNPSFYTLFCDQSGSVHIAWGGSSVFHARLHQFSNRARDAGRKVAGQPGTEPTANPP